ncbi:MAG: hypothetical protein ACWGNV_17355 [Bacteroidales bacterium]
MKIKLIFLILAIGFQNTYTQTRNYLTAEVGADYYYYFLEESHSYQLSYGSSILLSDNFNRFKIASGLSYANKSYTSPGSDFHNSKLHEHTLKYLNFPIIAGFKILSYEKFFIRMNAGFVFSRIMDYTIKTTYLNGEFVVGDGLLDNRRLGGMLMIGPTFSRSINEKLMINLSSSFYYKTMPDSNNYSPDYKNIPEDKIAIGIRLGIEYIFSMMSD